MDTWFSKELGDGVDAFTPSAKIQEAFLELVKSGSPTEDFSVFSRYDLHTNVVTVYFTPRAAALAAMFDAKPSEKPVLDKRLGLLVGDASSWQIHFPNRKTIHL